jgi:hypothetical protein
MRNAVIFTAVLALVMITGCVTQREGGFVYREDLSNPPPPGQKSPAMAMVFLGAIGGNGILIVNSNLFDQFRIYRKTYGDFEPAETIKKDIRRSDKGVSAWVDEGFTSFAVYRIAGIGKDGKEYAIPTMVSTPRQQSK